MYYAGKQAAALTDTNKPYSDLYAESLDAGASSPSTSDASSEYNLASKSRGIMGAFFR